MNQKELLVAVEKIRRQIKVDPELAQEFTYVIERACYGAGLELPQDFFDGLTLAHASEMNTAPSVTSPSSPLSR